MSRAHAVIGLGYGDEGKGTVVDYLVKETGARLVVRHNGGPQAAHNVVHDDWRHHTFSQFGSGTLRGARTLLSRYVAVDLPAMAEEANHLMKIGVSDPFSLMTVDRDCLVILPAHRALNHWRETSRGADKHGTCGVGFGECIADSIGRQDAVRVADLLGPRAALSDKVKAANARAELVCRTSLDLDLVNEWWIELSMSVASKIRTTSSSADVIASELSRGDVVFEGAQGVLLDEHYGFQPHTTWSTTTFRNAEVLAREADPATELRRIGVTRTFATRHGAGPLLTEDEEQIPIPGEHNSTHPWQGAFRTGALDLVALSYAAGTIFDDDTTLDAVALTHADMIDDRCRRVCTDYTWTCDYGGGIVPILSLRGIDVDTLEQCKPIYSSVSSETEIIRMIEETCNAPVAIVSRGKRAGDKETR